MMPNDSYTVITYAKSALARTRAIWSPNILLAQQKNFKKGNKNVEKNIKSLQITIIDAHFIVIVLISLRSVCVPQNPCTTFVTTCLVCWNACTHRGFERVPVCIKNAVAEQRKKPVKNAGPCYFKQINRFAVNAVIFKGNHHRKYRNSKGIIPSLNYNCRLNVAVSFASQPSSTPSS